MPKVKITNLKFGACVINSLRLTIPGRGSVVRDASVVGDPDLVELESEGIVSVAAVEDVKPPAAKPAPQPAQQPAQQAPAAKHQKGGKKADQPKGKPQAAAKQQPQQPQQPAQAKPKPGTDFRAMDNDPADEMGRKVVIMGENGPIVKHMNEGINGQGPKFLGDPFDDGAAPDEPAEGFVDVTT